MTNNRPGTVAVSVAITLALLGGLATALGALSAVHTLTHGYSAGFAELTTVKPHGWLRAYYWTAAVADPAAALLLVGGAVLVLARRRLGQILLTVGCVLVIAVGVFESVVAPDLLGSGPAGAVDRVVYLALLAFPVATLALAWSRSTRYRCRPRPAR